jgi:Protein of unknown function (DUF1176)
MRIVTSIAVAVTLFLAGAAQAAGGDKTVKDWVAVCDNLATCSAFGFSPENGDRDSWVKITRAAGPEAAPKVVVAYDIPDAQPDATWTLTLDGQPVAGLGPLKAKGSDSGARTTLTGSAAQALVAALRNGQTLEIRQDGKVLIGMSLAGSSAIMLWIDDQQGRVGTVTAMAHPGPKPASAVPPAPPEPVVVAAPAVSQAKLPKPLPNARVTALQDCVAAEVGGDKDDPLIVRLSPGVILWAPECEEAAYNETFVLFLGDETGKTAKRISLPTPPGETPPGQSVPFNLGWDQATRTMSAFAKGRGLGDCGSADSWIWDGKAFQLVSETEIETCRAVTQDDWPSRYQARRR